jgi:ribosomal protein S13
MNFLQYYFDNCEAIRRHRYPGLSDEEYNKKVEEELQNWREKQLIQTMKDETVYRGFFDCIIACDNCEQHYLIESSSSCGICGTNTICNNTACYDSDITDYLNISRLDILTNEQIEKLTEFLKKNKNVCEECYEYFKPKYDLENYIKNKTNKYIKKKEELEELKICIEVWKKSIVL